jgi:predicted DNA-binding ribbon-helix-helix protein
MVRTQIQLTEAQAKTLRTMAAAEKISLAELIRRSVDQFVQSQPGLGREARIARAKAAAGRFSSGRSDIGSRHDEFLGDAFDPR